ncbi:hypothetical protein IFM89_016767 [Coptis chinensis]|uniref:30S ribosomal protein S6 n=1 Tax=Coptis chinensis TaxID=261450 RepID=A0A835LFE2_9MAGN|nr:hypothetical protein IFM89_016767 [Coptis chinensis]
MEVLNTALSPTFSHSKNSHTTLNTKLFISANGCFSPSSFSNQKLCITGVKKNRRGSVITEAKKKKKADSHSAIPKPDEATGPFPEAVLLKEKKLQEDGRVLPDFADAEEEKLFEFLNLQMESDLNLKEMRHYEVVYLIHEEHKDEVGSVNSKVEEFIKEKKGRIWRFSNWGLRRLAYKIRKAKNAHYILMNFELEASLINDFKSLLDKDERVIRHLVIKRDKAITEYCPPPPEFHTLRPTMDDDSDYDDEDDMGEEEDEDDDVEEDIIVVDDNSEEEKVINEGSTHVSTRKRAYA